MADRIRAVQLGDLLFSIVNLARKLDLDAEHSLRETTDRSGRRFAFMEERLAECDLERRCRRIRAA